MTTRPTEDPLPREPRLDAAWRAASNEEPPPALDAAILAAARREVGAKPQSLPAQAAAHARRRWWPLAAAATVAVIAIGVVQRAGHDELGAPPGGSVVVTDIPTPSAKSAAESPPPAKEAPRVARADATPAPPVTRNAESAPRADAPRRAAPNGAPLLEKKAEPARPGAAALPEPFPAASPKPDSNAPRDAIAPSSAPAAAGGIGATTSAPATSGDLAGAASAPQVSPPSAPVAQQSLERGSAQRQESAASFADSARAPAQSALRSSPVAKTATAGAAQEARIKNGTPLPIPDWIALIRLLRDEGKTADAVRELAAFRTAHADHERLLPPDLRDWRPAEK